MKRINYFFNDNIKQIYKLECEIAMDKGYNKSEMKLVALSKLFKGIIQIPHLDLCVTTKCTLGCKHCTQWNPYIQNKKVYAAKKIIYDMKKILKNVDYVHNIAVIGGEAFLHPELDKIISFLVKSSKVGRVQIVTNGTIMPNEKLLKAMKNRKIVVWVDDYETGDDAKKIYAECKKNKLNVKYKPVKEWYDFGILDKTKKVSDKNVIKKTYEECYLRNCVGLYDGILYRCGRSFTLANNKILISDKDIIKLSDIKSKFDMMKKIVKFYSLEYIDACAYCKRDYKNHKIKPGT